MKNTRIYRHVLICAFLSIFYACDNEDKMNMDDFIGEISGIQSTFTKECPKPVGGSLYPIIEKK